MKISIKTLIASIKILRPIHWTKNLSLYAALLFSDRLFDIKYFSLVTFAFIIFSLAASSVYILNDILDKEKDKNHPIKKNRPIASGNLPIPIAIIELISIVTITLFLSAQFHFLLIVILIYFAMQIGYSFYLKNIPVIDILIIAAGFILRVYAGAFVIDAHLSVWFLLCVISVALFLAAGKRRAELGALGTSGITRKSLSKYSPELLNAYVAMFGNAAWMSWSLFTFYESPSASKSFWMFFAELSKAITFNKTLMITIPFVIFSIMRYQSLIFEGRAETPEKLLLTDKALIISVAIWVFLVTSILYGGITL